MLKTGLKSFVYSFSVSLFAIVSANRAFFHEKQEPSSLDIQNKSIALYLADAKPSYVPVKKIALTSLPEVKEPQEPLHIDIEPEIIIASSLEPSDIPLEFTERDVLSDDVGSGEPVFDDKKIKLADVLYAPDMPVEMPEIEAKPIYQPETSVDIKLASAPIYNPETKSSDSIKSPPSALPQAQSETKNNISTKPKEIAKEDNALLVARNEKVNNIPLLQGRTNNGVNKVQIGDPTELRHVAYADSGAHIQSMTSEIKDEQTTDNTDSKKWKQLNDSPWVVAKSTGSKNLFANKNLGNKTDKEIAELIPLQKNQKGVLLASETAKNLIIPIPEEILNKEDITPQLAYPVTSDDKKKEIDINAKIKEAEKKEKEKKSEKELSLTPILTPIEDADGESIASLEKASTEVRSPDSALSAKKSEESFMNKISSIFNKPAKTISEATNKITEKNKGKRRSFGNRRLNSKTSTIMPAEMRLSFQPNKAEISGHTLNWIQAFASKTAQTPGMMLELRIDGTSSTKLQQKRLNLLYNILTHKGVDYSMISTVFTSRDPNSFILRTVAPEKNNNKQGVNNQKSNRYIQW